MTRALQYISISAKDLLKLKVKTSGGKKGIITEEGIRTNVNVGILYIESWLILLTFALIGILLGINLFERLIKQ